MIGAESPKVSTPEHAATHSIGMLERLIAQPLSKATIQLIEMHNVHSTAIQRAAIEPGE